MLDLSLAHGPVVFHLADILLSLVFVLRYSRLNMKKKTQASLYVHMQCVGRTP